MSISPEAGQSPYLDSTGSIQIAGHSQSPSGNLASTSIRPYLITAPFFVLIRPDLTGLTIVPLVVLVLVTQFCQADEVQIPPTRKSTVLFVSISFGSCRVGLMCSIPSR